MFNKLPLLLLLLCSPAFAEVKAVIDGPSKIEFGSLLVLSAKESICDNHDWIVDPKFTTPVRIDKQAKELWSGLPGPGTFTFTLVVTNKDAEIGYAQWTVEVTLPPWMKPTKPPIDPQQPQPVDPPPVSGIIKSETERLTKALNDKDTTSKLIYQLDVLLSKPQFTQQEVQQVIESVLATRSGESSKKDWYNQWRVPANSIITQEIGKGVPLRSCIEQLLEGLRSTTFATSVKTIGVAKIANCEPCIKFENEVKPQLKALGYTFVELSSENRKGFPYIEISVDGRKIVHTGFLSLQDFHSIVGK